MVLFLKQWWNFTEEENLPLRVTVTTPAEVLTLTVTP